MKRQRVMEASLGNTQAGLRGGVVKPADDTATRIRTRSSHAMPQFPHPTRSGRYGCTMSRRAWEQQKADDLKHQQRSGPGWHGELSGYAPVQGVGTVDGHHWYFRARWQAWSFEIAAPLDAGLGDLVGSDVAGWLAEEEWGEDEFAASYMPYPTAWAIIEQCIARFRDKTLPYKPIGSAHA
jgi:hypothetical protein